MVKVNGKDTDIAGKTLAEYLATTNYDMKRIAVERNGDIVPKAQDYISGTLAYMLDLGQGSGPMNHAFDLNSQFAK